MEQERVSSEHYDSLLQGMDGILMLFEAIAYEMPQGSQLRSEMEKALDHAEEYLAQEREGMYKFQSSAQTADNFLLEFIAAGDELVRNARVQLEIVMEGAPRRLQRIAREEICGVGREAIAGAFLRAGTRHVELEICYASARLSICVRDDGGAIDSIGLVAMQKRIRTLQGDMEVWSKHDVGTEVRFTIPASVAYSSPHSARYTVLTLGR